MLGIVSKLSEIKGFKRKRGKKKDKQYVEIKIGNEKKGKKFPLKYEGRDHTHTEVYTGTAKPVKIGGEGILPVTKIDDGEVWSERRVADEIQRALLPDETTKIVKADIAPKFVQTAQVTAEHVKRWIPKGVRSIRGRDPGYRMSDRLNEFGEMKKWAIPVDFFLVSTNTIEGEQFMTSDPDTRKYGMDVAKIIYENILQYGRRTLDELMEDMGAWQPELVSLVANGMLNDHYLKIVEELVIDPFTGKPILDDNGKKRYLQTLELVEENERLERIKKYRKELTEKKAKALENGKPDKKSRKK